MFVPVACVKCGKPFQVPEAVAGTNVNCPWCKESGPALPIAGHPASDQPRTEPVGGSVAVAPLSLDDDQPKTIQPNRRTKPMRPPARRFPFFTAAIVLLLSVFAFSCTLFTRGYHAGRVSDSSWSEFTPPDGSCTVELIGEPKSEKLPAMRLPVSLTGEEFISQGWYSGVRTWVGWYDLDAGWAKAAAEDKDGSQIDPVLNEGQRKRVEVLKGTLQKEGKLLFNAYRGRELQVETERGIVVERLFVVPTGSHPRLFFVGMEGKNLNPTGPAATRMFTSFRINDNPAAASPIGRGSDFPIWGWVCIGLVAVVALGFAWIIWSGWQSEKRLQRDGVTVVARIILANTSLYETKPKLFEFAFVLFTRDADPSERHLAFLGHIAENLKEFEPNEAAPDEKKLAWAIETQRTIGDMIRIPDRVTGGREVYFATTTVKRRMLPDGKLTREYLYLRVVLDGKHRGERSMLEYPDSPNV